MCDELRVKLKVSKNGAWKCSGELILAYTCHGIVGHVSKMTNHLTEDSSGILSKLLASSRISSSVS